MQARNFVSRASLQCNLFVFGNITNHATKSGFIARVDICSFLSTYSRWNSRTSSFEQGKMMKHESVNLAAYTLQNIIFSVP